MENRTESLEVRLAKVIQENQEREAQAVKGYTEQLSIIYTLIEESDDANTTAFYEKLKSETEEKISDELNHQQGLLMEYVEFTGIEIKGD